jgi:hypothetical protein
MSLYNLLFGTNPFSGLLLEMLGTDTDHIPRYRDCYLNEDGKIVIHTRTGGGNRESYESGGEYWEEGQIDNDTIRAVPGFISDSDDDFDCTYADFVFEVPEAFKPQVELLKNMGGTQNPGERWQEVLEGLRKGDTSKPEVQRALAVGERILGQIKAASDAGETGKIIEV